jgi:5'-methylthioadenosine phosphorylase
MNQNISIGIIGGSGLYEMEELIDVEHIAMETPFGSPSDTYIIGTLEGIRVAFLSRHGKGHRLSPSELNFRANIYGFKKLGVEHLISVTAVGSLKESIRPLDIVVPDQFFDCTKTRHSTFFGNGLVAHIAFADPVCPDLAQLIYKGGTQVGAAIHKGGTLLCIEGPAFSTRAESNVYRQWGMDIIGMTAMVTDFDCWHAEESEVNVETVVQNLKKNISLTKKIIRTVVPKISAERKCICARALKNAIMTEAGAIPPKTRKKLELLGGKYLKD